VSQPFGEFLVWVPRMGGWGGGNDLLDLKDLGI